MQNYFKLLMTAALGIGLVLLSPGAFVASGQTTTSGTVTVTVLDPTGASVPDAQLEIKDVSTNNVRRAITPASGTYTFPNLPFGIYRCRRRLLP
ncbi:MAG: carboxypeptidase-like regulatory domain-containing protein [Acidobacteriia bacterium]|nr:carboxypeptidase-like regulatory domain-containing protein [Terriglobia bacterium]